MKIAILNNLYAPYDRGGAEKVAARQIDELQRSGEQVVLITTKPYGASPKPDETGLKIHHIESQFYSLGGWPIFLRPFWHLANIFSWRKYYRIKKILRQEKPDRIISHNLMGLGFMAPLAIRKLAISHEHWLHDIQLLHPSGLMIFGREKKIDGLAARLYQSMNRQLFGSPEKIISPSRWLLNEHEKRAFFSDSSKSVAPNDVSQPEADNRPAQTKKLLFVGQIETHKGIHLLIDAFKTVADPEITLTVVGDGSQLEAAKKSAAADGRITFAGRLSTTGTKKAMSQADWLIVPSLCYENSPTVIREAHALSLPVIAAALGGIPEMTGVSDKLFAPGDAADLAAKIAETL